MIRDDLQNPANILFRSLDVFLTNVQFLPHSRNELSFLHAVFLFHATQENNPLVRAQRRNFLNKI